MWFSNAWIDFNTALANNPWRYTVIDSAGLVIYDNRTSIEDYEKLPNFNLLGETITAYGTTPSQGYVLIRNKMQQWSIVLTSGGLVRSVHIEAPTLS